MSTPFEQALAAIDAAHALDPTTTAAGVPDELDYARKMTAYLARRAPDASEALRLAARAQHLRRWEVPRARYPMTRPGYHAWRTALQRRQAAQARAICVESGYSDPDADRVAALIRKEDLRRDEEVQALEDVACLVFLDDRFDAFLDAHRDEDDKVIAILRKTWGKMSERGHSMALEIPFDGRAAELVQKALAG